MDWVKIVKLNHKNPHHGDGFTLEEIAERYERILEEKCQGLDTSDELFELVDGILGGNHATAHTSFATLQDYYVAFSSLNTTEEKIKIGFDKDLRIVTKNPVPKFVASAYNSTYIKDGEGAYVRDTDTEAKLLEKIYADLCSFGYNKETAHGTICIYTYYEPCPSCQDIGKQFQQKFDGIDITIYYKSDNSLKEVSSHGIS